MILQDVNSVITPLDILHNIWKVITRGDFYPALAGVFILFFGMYRKKKADTGTIFNASYWIKDNFFNMIGCIVVIIYLLSQETYLESSTAFVLGVGSLATLKRFLEWVENLSINGTLGERAKRMAYKKQAPPPN